MDGDYDAYCDRVEGDYLAEDRAAEEAELRDDAKHAQTMAQLFYAELSWRRSYDDYEHNLIRYQRLAAERYARARELYEFYASEVRP